MSLLQIIFEYAFLAQAPIILYSLHHLSRTARIWLNVCWEYIGREMTIKILFHSSLLLGPRFCQACHFVTLEIKKVAVIEFPWVVSSADLQVSIRRSVELVMRCQMLVLLPADNHKRHDQSTAQKLGKDVAPFLLSAVVVVVDVHEMIVFSNGTGRTNAGFVRNLHGFGSGNSSAHRADITLQSKPAGGSRTGKTLT